MPYYTEKLSVRGFGIGSSVYLIDIDWDDPTGTPPQVAISIGGVEIEETPGHSVGGSRVTIWIDEDGDGNIDIDEDSDGDGVIDPGEDVDGDGKLDTGEPRIQEMDGVPQNPPPPGSGPGTGTLPGPLNAPVPPTGKVRIGVRVDADITDSSDTTKPETVQGGIAIPVAP